MPSATKRPLTSRDLLDFQMVDDPQVAPDGSAVAWVHTTIDAPTNSYRAAIMLTDAWRRHDATTHGGNRAGHPPALVAGRSHHRVSVGCAAPR